MFRKIAVFLFVMLLVTSFSIPALASNSGVLSGMVIILDAGHGAETTNTFRGYDEQVAMLALAHKIKPLLEAHGATVHMTRSTPADVLLSARAAMANIWSLEALKITMMQNAPCIVSISNELDEIDRLISIMAKVITNPKDYESIYFNTPFSPSNPIHPDLARIFELQCDPVISDSFLFISLHSNATAIPIDTAAHGADIFHISNEHHNLTDYYTNYSHIEQSMAFGEVLLDHIHETGIQRFNVKQANFFVLREHNLPAVLVENCHHTNPADRAKLMNDEYLGKLAQAYLEAILEFYGNRTAPLQLIPPNLLHFSSFWERHNFRTMRFNLGTCVFLR